MLLALGDWGETMAETIAGGYYIGEDGRPHDAFGRPLGVSQETSVDVMDGMDEVASTGSATDGSATGTATGAAKKGRRK